MQLARLSEISATDVTKRKRKLTPNRQGYVYPCPTYHIICTHVSVCVYDIYIYIYIYIYVYIYIYIYIYIYVHMYMCYIERGRGTYSERNKLYVRIAMV